jgi:hypothetical protein
VDFYRFCHRLRARGLGAEKPKEAGGSGGWLNPSSGAGLSMVCESLLGSSPFAAVEVNPEGRGVREGVRHHGRMKASEG